MSVTKRGMAVWTAGTAAAATLVLAAPVPPALACGGPAPPGAATGSADTTTGTRAPTDSGTTQVIGPRSLDLPAGAAARFAITFRNPDPAFSGTIALSVRATDSDVPRPPVTVEQADPSGALIRWRQLSAEGAAGTLWFESGRLRFGTGMTSTEFRIGVPAETAPGARLQIDALVKNTRGVLGATGFPATVTEAPLQVRTTFPASLRRGDGYRPFDIVVRNPSDTKRHRVRVNLAVTPLAGTPVPRTAGSLTPSDIVLEGRIGGRWLPIPLHPGCDPVYSATLTELPDLAPGASQFLRLRLRIADSPATTPHPALYYVTAHETGARPDGPDTSGHVDGSFLIRPHRTTPAGPPSQPSTQPATQPKTRPTTEAPAPVPTPSGPTAGTDAPAPAATRLADTGPSAWPLVAGLTLGLCGLGALATLLALRRRRPDQL
jgi:hypothetical protein